jgi:hypothetical protein
VLLLALEPIICTTVAEALLLTLAPQLAYHSRQLTLPQLCGSTFHAVAGFAVQLA